MLTTKENLRKAVQWHLERCKTSYLLEGALVSYWRELNNIEWEYVRQAFLQIKDAETRVGPLQIRVMAIANKDAALRDPQKCPRTPVKGGTIDFEGMGGIMTRGEPKEAENDKNKISAREAKAAFFRLADKWEREIDNGRYASKEDREKMHHIRMEEFHKLWEICDLDRKWDGKDRPKE